MKRLLSLLLPLLLLSGPTVLSQSQAQTVELIFPHAHANLVDEAFLSKDGKMAVTASSKESTVKIWDVTTGKLLRSVSSSGIIQVFVTPDFKYIVCGGTRASGYGDFISTSRLMTIEIATGKINSVDEKGSIASVALSPDGTKVATSCTATGTVKIWETATLKMLSSWTIPTRDHNLRFSNDGQKVLGAGGDKFTVWSTSGVLQKSIATEQYEAEDAIFTPDGSKVLTFSKRYSGFRLWDLATAQPLKAFLNGGLRTISNLQISADGKYVLSQDLRDRAVIWDMSTAQPVYNFERLGYTDAHGFSPDSKYAFVGSKLFDLAKGAIVYSAESGYGGRFSADSKSIITNDGKIIEVPGGKTVVDHLGIRTNSISNIQLRGDNSLVLQHSSVLLSILNLQSLTASELEGFKAIAIPSMDDVVLYNENEIRHLNTKGVQSTLAKVTTGFIIIRPQLVGKKLYYLEQSTYENSNQGKNYKNNLRVIDLVKMKLEETVTPIVTGDNVWVDIFISPSGKHIMMQKNNTYYADFTVYQLSPFQQVYTVKNTIDKTLFRDYLGFSPDGKYFVLRNSGDGIDEAELFETATGQLVSRINVLESTPRRALFSADGRTVAVQLGRKVVVHDLTTKTNINEFSVDGDLGCVDWAKGHAFVYDRSKITIVDIKTGQTVVNLTMIDKSNWIATHPSGLFDATPGAMDKMYFVQGLDVIDFNQLKERYYEPGLWKRCLAMEELRNVEAFKSIELPPDVEPGSVNAQGILPVKVINRGGGIGEVTVFINGKEIIKDARPAGTNAQSATITLQISINKYSALLVPGQDNYIGVKAWNASHWVVNRGKLIAYKMPSKADIKPAIHILACGVSDYTGSEIDLKYAAKDANDMANALALGAKNLFGANSAYVYKLTTGGSKEDFPTKARIRKAFDDITKSASSSDVVVVYLAGHGITWGGQDGDFYYLTQDAYSNVTSAYNDPAIRSQSSLSSTELVELLKNISAQKQVVIIDACGSGKAVDNLMSKRDIPSSTLRALDRMKDRTGVHIITGCAADAVSYEATQFGQGVLTYSLLEGIRGAALREEKFVDVNQLFQYAQDRVPALVTGLGGVQTPQVFSPFGSQSFDIGQLSDTEKKAIPIARIRPVFVKSALINKNSLDDNMQLGKKIDEKLNDMAMRGAESDLVFVNVPDYPEGCKVSGIYEQTGDGIVGDIKKKCSNTEKKYTVKGQNVDEFVENLLGAVKN